MFLIDTDILIYSLKQHETVVAQFEAHAHEPKALSVVSYGELYVGALRSGRRAQNLAQVRRIAELFPVIEVSRAIMETFAGVKADLLGKGTPVDDFDLLIAATALVHGLRLVTNNERHFKRVRGLHVENWAKPA